MEAQTSRLGHKVILLILNCDLKIILQALAGMARSTSGGGQLVQDDARPAKSGQKMGSFCRNNQQGEKRCPPRRLKIRLCPPASKKAEADITDLILARRQISPI